MMAVCFVGFLLEALALHVIKSIKTDDEQVSSLHVALILIALCCAHILVAHA